MANQSDNQTESARLFYQFAIWKLTEQNRSIESIERKIASSIATWGILIVVVLGLFAFDQQADTPAPDQNDVPQAQSYLRSGLSENVRDSTAGVALVEESPIGVPWEQFSFILVLIMLFLAAAYCAVRGYRTQKWKTGPTLDVVRRYAGVVGEEKLLFRLGTALYEAQQKNEASLSAKGKWCDRALLFSLIGLVAAMFLAVVIRFIH